MALDDLTKLDITTSTDSLLVFEMGNNESGVNHTGVKALDRATSSEPAAPKDLPPSTAEAWPMSENQCHDTIKGEKEEPETSEKAEKGDEKVDFDFKAWADDFFEREYKEHQWSAGAHVSSSQLSTLAATSGDELRYLEPGEELLTESEESENEQEPFLTWTNRTRFDAATSSNLSMWALQWCMDKDKEYCSGIAFPEYRQKSCLKKKSIGDRVERGRRIKWAEEMGKRHPGRYVPYPGRPVRAPPSRSSFEKGRRLQCQKESRKG
ncbi:hypothetical protein PV04_03781 [Phialophora macrospora]|uniref:Uncharacterized protein n=1 Tax=Phialophora macrospora TaxID=1851006 RepID=A0A0D2FYT1_9EURO|nr:hypothetical protein PV04_03781 [Phialophora macrospora]